MNEMNNGENNFNNQNFGQQNMNQNNVVEPVQQQYVQPTEPPKKEEKKSYCGLLIVFMVISLLLTGYIVYDKVIKKEEPIKQNEEKEINKPQDEAIGFKKIDMNQFSEQSSDDSKYYTILTYNNANLKLEFKLYYQKLVDGSGAIYYDLYVNGNLKKENFAFYDIKSSTKLSLDEEKALAQENVKNSVGTIYGDKYYVYYKDEETIIVFNSKNEIIFEKEITHSDIVVALDRLCPNLNLFLKDKIDDINEMDLYAIINGNSIYYIDTDFVEISNEVVEQHRTIISAKNTLFGYNQYKVEFENDKAKETKVEICVGYYNSI